MANFPFLVTSLVAMPCSEVNTAFTSFGFCPVFDEMAAKSPPADMEVDMAFIAFIAFIAFMAIAEMISAGGLVDAGAGLIGAQ